MQGNLGDGILVGGVEFSVIRPLPGTLIKTLELIHCTIVCVCVCVCEGGGGGGGGGDMWERIMISVDFISEH